MALRTHYAEEPLLLFGNHGTAVDPRVGMLNHGPNGLDEHLWQSRVIRVGAVGSFGALTMLRGFLVKLRQAWAAPANTMEKPWKVHFPGLGVNGPLGFEFELDRTAVQSITEQEENEALSSEDRRERIEAALQLYQEKIDDLVRVTHPAPPLVLLPLSERVMESCRDPHLLGDNIVATRRNVSDEDLEQETDLGTHDFHNALKVLTFRHNIPCQLLKPATMRLEGQTTQDSATVAWNISAGMYYKATGNPWKLTDMDDQTLIVGISFYKEVGETGTTSMRASMAHVHLRSAESQVILGEPFEWRETRKEKEPHLSREQARDLLEKVIKFYGRQRRAEGKSETPARVVLHKTSPFKEAETEGFDSVLPNETLADYVHVERRRSIRFYHEGLGFPPVRGTLVYDPDKALSFLYTVGFVPALRTYPGSSVAAPVALNSAARRDTSHEQIASDIMSLTKLDWNSTDFCSRLPVTTSVSWKVGKILSEARARKLDPPAPYRFYM